MDTYKVQNALDVLDVEDGSYRFFDSHFIEAIGVIKQAAKELVDAGDKYNLDDVKQAVEELSSTVDRAQCALGDLEDKLTDVQSDLEQVQSDLSDLED